MVEIDLATPHDPKNLLDGGGDGSPLGAPKKSKGGHKRTTSCNEEYAIATFKIGLPVQGELHKSLNMSPVGTLAKLMERIEQHARNEDDILWEDDKMVAEQNEVRLLQRRLRHDQHVMQLGKKRGRDKKLCNEGSCTEVLYYDAFKKLGLTQSDLEQSMTPLVGFGVGAVWPLGKVTLPVRVGTVVLRTDFLVVDVPSSYNAIIGRAWLHKMRAISSTYHQMVRFPGSNGIERIRGNQRVAHQCLISIIKKAPKAKMVQAVEVPKQPTIEDVRGNPAEKVVDEGLKKIQINKIDPKRYFLIGENLSKKEEEELIGFLKEHVDMFAWVPEEMPGVDANHIDAIIKEVDRLLEAKAIREVYYPEWLSNTVVVKKKNGKWRVCVDFMNLNKACPKDSFPLPRIDQLVDATAGYGRMSFLDAYRGYHQIAKYEPDQEKTSFITPRGLYCYSVMPFGLRNAGATYQRLATIMLKKLLGKTMEVYIDDMVVKSKENSGKFLGHLVTIRRIEANLDQIAALQMLQSPKTTKEVQRLTGMAAALNRFISRSSDKCRPFFQLLKKSEGYEWGAECERAFQDLNKYLAEAPLLSTLDLGESLILYLAVSEHAVSAVLLRNKGSEQIPVYYVSKTLLDAETKYLSLEKLVLALRTTARKLPHYFQSHKIVVYTEFPLKSLLRKADFSGCISTWSVELSQYDIDYQPRTTIKGQILADFVAEFSPAVVPLPPTRKEQPVGPSTRKGKAYAEQNPIEWKLFVDGSASNSGSGVGVVLFPPNGVMLELSIRLGFSALNNVAEYEALLARLRSAKTLKVKRIRVYCDSQLVVNQLSGDYEARNEKMAAYVEATKDLLDTFEKVYIEQISSGQNAHADSLAWLAAAVPTEFKRKVAVDYLAEPSIGRRVELVLDVNQGPSWMDPVVEFL
ncbi:uncharacterized protein LOC131321193 [Rhododendron vialii]|uniref:uncharacterized protein LOC131321193 n=1 Tax=Rhododendron vialii TaxID=182163 RepID=UPI00265D6425|nr:uncharacterized protein LOC131321193 [Rhododendron vialii]